jgi:DNA-binding SARP family transcriptional activator
MPDPLKLLVLGKPEIYYHGAAVIDQIPAKALALLIYLAVTRQPATQATLAALLWGDQPEETARANLRLTLSRLRKVAGDCLLVTGSTIAFDFAQPHEVDLREFEAQTAHPAQADPARLAAALAFYRGELGQEFTLRDAPDFEHWLLLERTWLHHQAIHALTHLAEESYQQKAWVESITWTQRILILEPWQEEAHRRLIALLARTGQRSAALAQFETCRRLLADELAAQPSAETVALVERIRRGEVANAECEMRSAKCGVRNAECGIRTLHSALLSPCLVVRR